MERETPYEAVKHYHQAWTSGDIARAMSCVADDLTCRAPGIDLEAKDAYGPAPRGEA